MLAQLSSSPYVLSAIDRATDPGEGAPAAPPILPPLSASRTLPPDLPVDACPECSYTIYNHHRGVAVRAYAGRWVIECRDCGKHLALWHEGMGEGEGWRVICSPLSEQARSGGQE